MKKKNERLDRLRCYFHFDEYGKPVIKYFGEYRGGLTGEEIKHYLKVRANTTKLGKLYEKFCKTAGVNTMTSTTCHECGKSTTLMYRCDVERFTDVMLLGIPTYFD